MNLVSNHHFASMPGAYSATGHRSVSQNATSQYSNVQTERSAPAKNGVVGTTKAPAETIGTANSNTSEAASIRSAAKGAEPAQDAQRELRLQAQLRAKQTQEQRLIDSQIQALAARDREVRAHEQAHVAAGGQYAGAPVYQFERGPNGVSYAVGGEVPISTGAEATPEATLRKAQIIRRAALAPAEPSSQDRRVAAMASRLETSARMEISLASTRKEEDPTETESQDATSEANPSPSSPAEPTKPTDSQSSASSHQQEDAERLQRRLFTRDKMASTPPGTLFSHMA